MKATRMPAPASSARAASVGTGARLVLRIPFRALWGMAGWLALLVTLALGGGAQPGAPDELAAAARARASFRYDRALAFYAQASASAPDDPRPRCLAADTLMLQEEWDAAARMYARCATLAPQDASVSLRRGDALAQAGDQRAAALAWRAAADGGASQGWRRLGALDAAAGRFADAVADWSHLPPDDPQARMQLGLLSLQRGDYTTARADFAVAQATPNADAGALRQSGVLGFVAAPPNSPETLGLLGYTFLTMNLPSFALAPLRAALALDPANGAANAYLGWALWLTGQRDAARAPLEHGARLAPELSFAWFATGEEALSDGDLAGARADFQRGVTLDARNPTLWVALGQAALAQYDDLAAELAFTNAAALATRPEESEPLLRLYAEQNLDLAGDRSRAAAGAALARWPDNATIRLLVAQIDDRLGQEGLAYATCLQARALDPGDPGAYVMLGRYAENAGDYVSAALDLRTALALRPHGPLAAEARALLAPLAGVEV